MGADPREVQASGGSATNRSVAEVECAFSETACAAPVSAADLVGKAMSFKMSNLKRIQIDMTEAEFSELSRHMEWCNSKTKTDHFNMVYTLFEEALKAVKAGKDIGIVDREKEKYEVLKFPALESARRHFGAKGGVTLEKAKR